MAVMKLYSQSKAFIGMCLLWVMVNILRSLGSSVCVLRNHIFVQAKQLSEIDYLDIHSAIVRLSDVKYVGRDVYLHINSNGGVVRKELVRLLDCLEAHPSVIATTFGSKSAAAFIFLAAPVRWVSKHGRIVVHGIINRFPVGMMTKHEGRLTLPQDWSDFLEEYQARLRATLQRRTQIEPSLIESAMSGEVTFLGSALVEFKAAEGYL